MVPPDTAKRLGLAASLLAVGLAAAGRIGYLDAAAVGAFAVGAIVTSSTDLTAALTNPFALVPVVLLLVALGLGGFGNFIGAVALVGCAVAAGAVAATV
ncbi:hypothetical protein [Halorarius halobius]|uniref:hypothetical protein n=1 Tax=Halorarius halobius TaxID=2962671 RepID=UPI0020CCA29C|nr:hypothetical protein [Halorarius halobius]